MSCGSVRARTSGKAIESLCSIAVLRPSARERDEAKARAEGRAKTSIATTPTSDDDGADDDGAGKGRMRVRKVLVVAHGGKGLEHEMETIRREFASGDIACEFVETSKVGDATTIVRERDLRGVDAIGVMGGDGTFREAVEGFMTRKDYGRKEAKDCAVFTFPCGTGNNYARDLGITTVADAVNKVKNGRVKKVDAVKVSHGDEFKQETISINVVTWGMARDAAETAEGMRFLGPIRYDLAGLYHILMNKKNFATIGVSEALEGAIEHESDEYLMMFAQNTRCSGRGFTFTPLAQLDDGEFDVMTCLKSGPLHTKGLFDATKSGGGHVEDPSVAYVKAKRLELSTNEPERVGIDGEVTVSTPVRLRAMKHAFLTFV